MSETCRPQDALWECVSVQSATTRGTVSIWAGNTTTFGHDANSNLVSISYPNGTTAGYSYDAADRTTAIADTGTGGVPFLSLPYTRDANGRIASDNPVPTPLPAPRAYGYDPAGRLASRACRRPSRR